MSAPNLSSHYRVSDQPLDPASNQAFVDRPHCAPLFGSEGFRARAQIEDPEAQSDQLLQPDMYSPLAF